MPEAVHDISDRGERARGTPLLRARTLWASQRIQCANPQESKEMLEKAQDEMDPPESFFSTHHQKLAAKMLRKKRKAVAR